MKRLMTLAALLALIATPALAMQHGSSSMNHGSGHGAMDHGSMNHGDMGGGSMMLGEEEVDGVKGMVHLNDVKAAMAKAGQPQTHHLMINFTYLETGKTIEKGSVAVKVTDPAGNETEPIMMMGMDGHFGVDLKLDKPGLYHFKIGTKLPDGKKRQFHSHQEIN